MQSVIDSMQTSLSLAGGSVGITALFIAGLISLWQVKFADNHEAGTLFWYAIASLVVIISPLYTWCIKKWLPDLTWSNMYLWILPVTPVVLYTGVLASSMLKNGSKKIMFAIGLIGLLFLATASSYKPGSVKFMSSEGFIADEDEEIFGIVEEYRLKHDMKQVLIWGSDMLMANARLYSGNISTIYGKEMWLGYEETGFNTAYEPWAYEAFNLMKQPADNLDRIGELGFENSVDVIIIDLSLIDSDDMMIPETIGDHYYLEFENHNYAIYVISRY